MKWDKKIIKSKKFHRILGWATLTIIITLLIAKLLIGTCKLWLCGLFVITVVGYSMLSDLKMKNEPGEIKKKFHRLKK